MKTHPTTNVGGLVLLVLLALGGPARAVEEVAPGVFVRAGVHEPMTAANAGAIANAGFVVGRSGVAVIDPGGSLEAGEALLAAIRARTDLPVRFVVVSSW